MEWKFSVAGRLRRHRVGRHRAELRASGLKEIPIMRSVVMAMDFLLNCFVLGDKEDNVFTVKIPKTDNVNILKKLIKEEEGFSELETTPWSMPSKYSFW